MTRSGHIEIRRPLTQAFHEGMELTQMLSQVIYPLQSGSRGQRFLFAYRRLNDRSVIHGMFEFDRQHGEKIASVHVNAPNTASMRDFRVAVVKGLAT